MQALHQRYDRNLTHDPDHDLSNLLRERHLRMRRLQTYRRRTAMASVYGDPGHMSDPVTGTKPDSVIEAATKNRNGRSDIGLQPRVGFTLSDLDGERNSSDPRRQSGSVDSYRSQVSESMESVV